MKKIIFIIIATFIAVSANSQFVHKIKADSVLITNDSCTAELNLENSTKGIKGFLYNKGNGRTEFRKGIIKIDDSIYIIGADTLNLAAAGSSNSAWKIIGNSGTNPSINFLGTIDSIDLIIKTKGLENAIFNAGGGLTFRNANGQDKINLNKNGTGYLSVIHRFGQGENNYFSTPVSSSIIMDSAHKKGRGSAISGERQFISKNGVTINPSTLDGASVQGYMNLRMSKGNYNFYSDLTGGFNTSAITANIHVATENTSDSIARYTFYGNNGGVTTGLSAATSRIDFSWSKPSDNFGFYNNFLSAPLFSAQAGRYTEKFNHFAAAFTQKGASGRVGMVTGLYIENLLRDSVDRTWGVLQLGTNDWNAFRGKVMIGDSTQANAGLHRLYVDGRGRFTDTLTATTMGNADSSNRVATTAWVKNLGYAGGTGWNLNGNNGTNSGTNFLGTLDNVSLRFKTNNITRALIDSNGKFGINKITPDFLLDVDGDARVSTLPFLASRDTVLTYDPSTKQLKVTKLPDGPSTIKLTSDLSAYTSTSLTDASGLSFSVNANTYYHFKFIIVFSTASGNTGIRLSVSVPSSPDILSAKAVIPIAADGTASELTGWITSSNDAVVGTGVQTLNTDYIAIVEGTLLTGANAGTLQLRYASEVSSSGVTIKKTSFGQLVLY